MDQGLGQSASQLNVSLLTISVFAVVLPGVYHMAMSNISNPQTPDESSNNSDPKEGTHILQISHQVSDFTAMFVGLGA